jgi:hypothetical protein
VRSGPSILFQVSLLLVTMALACGGRVSGPADGGASTTSDDPEGGSSWTDNPGSPCPLLRPAAGIACDISAGQVCAYVGDGLPCQAFQCDGSQWQSTKDGC